MSDPAQGIMNLLTEAGIATPAAQNGWGIFVGKLPITPNTAVGIITTGGTAPNPKWLLDFPSVQVTVRGAPNGYVAARAVAQKIKDTLLGLPSQEVDGDWWDIVNMIGDIVLVGFDQNNCPLFTVNFALTIEPAAGDGTNRESL